MTRSPEGGGLPGDAEVLTNASSLGWLELHPVRPEVCPVSGWSQVHSCAVSPVPLPWAVGTPALQRPKGHTGPL